MYVLLRLQLFIIDDDMPLEYPKHYWGLYLAEQKIGQVRQLLLACHSNVALLRQFMRAQHACRTCIGS